MKKTKSLLCIMLVLTLFLAALPYQAAEAFRSSISRDRTPVVTPPEYQKPPSSPTTPPPSPSPQQPPSDSNKGDTGYNTPSRRSINQRSYTPVPVPTRPIPGPKPEPEPEPSPPPHPSEPLPDAPSWLNANEAKAFQLLNEFRVENGSAPLLADRRLTDVARAKAQDMIDNDYFGHISPTYGSVGNMLRSFGVSFSVAGENLSKAGTVARAQLQLENSTQGHKQNMLNTKYNKVGIAVLPLSKTPGVLLVQIFTD